MRFATAALALLALAAPAAAQGRWLDTFAVPGAYDGDGSGARVSAVAADGAGALVGGTFRIVDGVEANSVARWTGTAWEAFGGGVRRGGGPGTVNAVLRDAAGAVWVTGGFDRVVQPDGSSVAAGGLARWVGGRWTVPAFLVGLDTPGGGYALLEEGGSVYVAGQFFGVDTGGGVRTGGGGLVRWTDGQFSAVPRSPADVFALAAAPGGGVLFASGVPQPDGTGAVVIVRTDGQAPPQPITRPLYGPAVDVRALRVEADGIVVGGEFEGGRAADGSAVPSRNVIRWDGAAWQPFGQGVPGASVLALARDGTGLLAGGEIFEVGGIDLTPFQRGLMRWTGTSWVPVNGFSPRTVEALASQGSATLVGGAFGARSGQGEATMRAVNLATLSIADVWRPVSAMTGRDGTFRDVGTVFEAPAPARFAPDGCGGVHVYARLGIGPLEPSASGRFRRWDGAAWRPDLTRGSGLRSLYSDGPPGPTVTALAAVPGSCDAVVLAGLFSGATTTAFPGSFTSVNVVRWDGAAWRPLGRGVVSGGPLDGRVESAIVQPDGAVVIGGAFEEVQQTDGTTVRAPGIARWTAAAGWEALGGGLLNIFSSQPRRVRALLVEPGGAFVAGGAFDVVGSTSGDETPFVDGVARWTGTHWEPLARNLPVEGSHVEIAALARWNGLLVVGGTFSQIRQTGGGRLDARNVALWDGAAWRALPGLTTPVSALAVVDGTLVAADGLGGRAARWTGTAWVPLGDDPPRGATNLAAVGRRLYASGAFDTAGGVGSPGLAVFDLDATVAAEAPPADTPLGALRAYPNPARTSTTFAFRLDAAGPARLTLADVLGRTVAVLHDGALAAGEQTLRVDVSRLPAGVYAARLETGGRVETRRVTVVR